MFQVLARHNNNGSDVLSDFPWNGFPLRAFLYEPPIGQRPSKPGNGSSEQALPGQTSAGIFSSGPTGIAHDTGFFIGNAVMGGYNKSILPLDSIPSTNQGNINGTTHYMSQEAVAHSSWHGPGIYFPVRPVSSREALPYPTASSLAIPRDQTLPEWFQQNGLHEMRDAALASERFHGYQMSPSNPFAAPQMMGPIAPVSHYPNHTYGFTNATPMVPVYGGVPIVYPAMPSPRPVPHGPHPMHENDDGTPINVAQGFISIERRGVYVHNLNHDATSKDLEDLFRQVGPVEGCEILKGPDKGKQCKATVAFRSEGEAKAAIDKFDKKPFMGRPLAVRLNKDPTTAQEAPKATKIAGPSSESTTSTRVIIANGSMGDLPDIGDLSIDGGGTGKLVTVLLVKVQC